MEQWKKSLEQFLQFDITPPEPQKGRGRKKKWSPVGQLGAGKDTLHGIVDIAVMQSLISDYEVKSLVKDYGMVIETAASGKESIQKFRNKDYDVIELDRETEYKTIGILKCVLAKK